MLLRRDPSPVLRPFVRTLWAAEQPSLPHRPAGCRERVFPTGDMHIAFRLSDHPLWLFRDVDDPAGYTAGHAVLGGARATPYVRDTSAPARSVGALLRPGAAQLLFGEPADTFAGRHTLLDDLWGRSAALAREQLLDAGHPERQLDILESILAARLPRLRGIHPAVAQALEQFPITPDVREAVKQSGYSHRRFITLFRQAVGLTPKLYCRLLRFRRAVDRIKAAQVAPWAGLALAAGYSDQAHFNREFREFAGVTPEAYRKISPQLAFHVPVLPSTS
ncbi:MAG: helix-turn-helix domain-containing protein [Gemmatimonadaceae bacterium]